MAVKVMTNEENRVVNLHEPPPPYNPTFSNNQVRIEMNTNSEDTKKNKKPSMKDLFKDLHLDNELYIGDGKSCPLTCGIISARAAAWVFALVYIAAHFALIFKMREPGHDPFVRDLVTCISLLHIGSMTAAFVGLCRKRAGLMIPFIVAQYVETVLLTIATVIWMCVPFLYTAWCLASETGDPYRMFTKSGILVFAICCALVSIAAHLLLALIMRAAMATDSVEEENDG